MRFERHKLISAAHVRRRQMQCIKDFHVVPGHLFIGYPHHLAKIRNAPAFPQKGLDELDLRTLPHADRLWLHFQFHKRACEELPIKRFKNSKASRPASPLLFAANMMMFESMNVRIA